MSTTIETRVDGLKAIYTCEKDILDVYFEFESAEKAEAAVKGVINASEETNCLGSLTPEQKQKYATLDILRSDLVPLAAINNNTMNRFCGYYAKPSGCVGTPIKSIDVLMNRILAAMQKTSPASTMETVTVIAISPKQLK